MGDWSRGDWNLKPGETTDDRDRRVLDFEAQERAWKAKREEGQIRSMPGPTPSNYPTTGGPLDRNGAIFLLAFALSITPWILLFVLEVGSGVQYIRFTLLFVLIFGVAYIIARVFVAVWKLLLIVSLAAFAYYAYGLWSAKSDIVSPSRENTLRAKTKSSNGTPRPRR